VGLHTLGVWFRAGLALAVLLLRVQGALAQGPDTLWARIYGGPAADAGYWAQQTPDSGFIVVGETASFGAGGRDVFVVKTDGQGDTVWLRTYGGPKDDYGRVIIHAPTDSSYIILGTTNSFGPGRADVLLININMEGDTLWMRTYGRTAVHDYGSSIQRTEDGGYIIAGYTIPIGGTDHDILLIRTDAGGQALWMKTYGSPAAHDYAFCVRQCSGGGYIVAGRRVALDDSHDDIILMGTSPDGEIIWERALGGPGHDYCQALAPTRDGGFIAVGYTSSFGAGLYDIYVIKLRKTGGILWQRTYGGPRNDYGYSIQATDDGGYLIAGETESFGKGSSDVYVIKTDYRGRVAWTRGYGGPGPDGARYARRLPDGTCIITGRSKHFGAGQYAMLLLRLGAGPADLRAPDLSLAVFQNPYLSQYLDVSVVGSEDLDSASVSLEINQEPVNVRLISRAGHTWMGDYKLKADQGLFSIVASASDVAGNDTTVVASFAGTLLRADLGGSLSSPDGKVSLMVDGGVLGEDTYVVIVPELETDSSMDSWSWQEGALNPLAPLGTVAGSYVLGPGGSLRRGKACLAFRYSETDLQGAGSLDQLYIAQEGLGPLPCYIDPGEGQIKASISQLGRFRLLRGRPGMSCVVDPSFLSLNSPSPNPFAEQAAVRFEIRARQWIKVTVYDVLGRQVASLFDGMMYPGPQEVWWDGRSVGGDRVCSGTYFVEVRTPQRKSATKVILTR
jgi:hypothetical protein